MVRTPSETVPLTINRIRVETALSRFPIHRLARKGNVSIDLQRLTESGEADFKWEVSYNAKYGQPGPLAYKVDTLIVNRRIDEAGRPLPELIKLGSLTDICQELGMVDSGENRAHIKKSLLQDAFAAITAKIRYKTKTGKEKWAEIGYTRYSVVFTGELLPDGRQADSVYILLNPPYRDLLNQVEVRPLDYDYLKQLAPGAQRLYELLSFQIYGALASGRPRAKMLYSEYCKYAPQTRYPDFDHVKKQMYKVHVSHRESGYIAKVDYEETVDSEGCSDWQMFYTPGPKACEEFRAFTKRNVEHKSLTAPAAKSAARVQKPLQARMDLSEAETTLLHAMISRGITEKKALELLADAKTGQDIGAQIEYFDHLQRSDVRCKIASPTGFLVSLIRDNTLVPPNYRLGRQQGQKPLVSATEEIERARLLGEYEAYQQRQVEKFIKRMPKEEREALFQQLRQANQKIFANMTATQLEETTNRTLVLDLKESGKVPMLTFDKWKKQTSKKTA
jgi:hypothetical protein